MNNEPKLMWSCKYWKTKGVECNNYNVHSDGKYASLGMRCEQIGREVFHTKLEAYERAADLSCIRKMALSYELNRLHTLAREFDREAKEIRGATEKP